MLAVVGQPNANLAAEQPRRATYKVEWVDIDDPDPSFHVHAGPDRTHGQRHGHPLRR